jgi:membrane associated rhomboid family serine protease
MLYLSIFGAGVEDAFGRTSYLLFHLTSDVVANVTQILADPSAQVLGLRASGAPAQARAGRCCLPSFDA